MRTQILVNLYLNFLDVRCVLALQTELEILVTYFFFLGRKSVFFLFFLNLTWSKRVFFSSFFISFLYKSGFQSSEFLEVLSLNLFQCYSLFQTIADYDFRMNPRRRTAPPPASPLMARTHPVIWNTTNRQRNSTHEALLAILQRRRGQFYTLAILLNSAVGN